MQFFRLRQVCHDRTKQINKVITASLSLYRKETVNIDQVFCKSLVVQLTEMITKILSCNFSFDTTRAK